MLYFRGLAAATILTMIQDTAADPCARGLMNIAGNWYCQAVDSIRYSNVGTAGTYRQVVAMNSDGSCKSTTKQFKGPLSPLDEEVRLLSVDLPGD